MLVGALQFSVIIPSYNRPAKLCRALRALAVQSLDPILFEVVVVDDGSDPPIRLPSELGSLRVQLFREANAGAASARNFGARRSRGRYLAFMDDDCVPEPGWLAGFADHASELDGRVLLGGSTHNAHPSNVFARFNQHLIEAVLAEVQGTTAQFCLTNNCCVSKAEFEISGGFDIRFTSIGGEDREFGERWTRSGRTMSTAPGASLWHSHPQGMREFLQTHHRYGAGARTLMAMRPDQRGPLAMVPLMRQTLQRTGCPGIGLYMFSQAATVAGFYEKEISGLTRFGAGCAALGALVALAGWLSTGGR